MAAAHLTPAACDWSESRARRDPRLHDPPRHALRRDLHGAGPRAPARRPADDARHQRAAVAAYREPTARKSDLDRTDLAKTKTGVFTGGHAINPVNGESIPVWIADYVLMGYGTGAIMAVPGHDERDFEFAQAFDLPIVRVVAPSLDAARMPRSSSAEPESGHRRPFAQRRDHARRPAHGRGQDAITAWLESSGLGKKTVNYKLRDWLFSRQRYWGEPFPVVLRRDDRSHAALEESELPVRLPELDDFKPTGKPEPPLGKATDWVRYSEKIPARDQHDAAVGRLVLVLPAVHRPAERQGSPGTRERENTGCRSICMSAGPSTPCCTCSTAGSGTRCSSTAAWSARRSRFRSWSTRG